MCPRGFRADASGRVYYPDRLRQIVVNRPPRAFGIIGRQALPIDQGSRGPIWSIRFRLAGPCRRAVSIVDHALAFFERIQRLIPAVPLDRQAERSTFGIVFCREQSAESLRISVLYQRLTQEVLIEIKRRCVQIIKVFKRAVLPSISASCYASIHTGVAPAVHGCTGNGNVFRLAEKDVFAQVRAAGGVTGAVAHSFWSEFFNRAPFDYVRDIEYDEPQSETINHGRFHTMTGYGLINQMTPSDVDLFATLTNLCLRFGLNYGMLHTCTLDSMGHRFFHDCQEMDHACATRAAWLRG